jgi:hypothetical protein
MIYDYSEIGGEDNLFLFETEIGIIYQIKFKPSPYLLNTFAPYF